MVAKAGINVGITKALDRLTGAPENLGGVDLSAATAANAFAASGANYKISVNVVNRNATAIDFKMGISDTSATFENANYLEYNLSIPAYGVLERTNLGLQDSKYLVAESDTANVTVTIHGTEG